MSNIEDLPTIHFNPSFTTTINRLGNDLSTGFVLGGLVVSAELARLMDKHLTNHSGIVMGIGSVDNDQLCCIGVFDCQTLELSMAIGNAHQKAAHMLVAGIFKEVADLLAFIDSLT